MERGALVVGVMASLFTFGPVLNPARADVPVVEIAEGAVSGTGGDVLTYRNIPFAAPPLGQLRWAPPQAPAPWPGVRDGSAFGADCVQPPYYPELRGTGQSEDCLTLNVWTPVRAAASSAKKLPVMVWIFGGGFVNGGGSHPTYEGTALARRGVVLVTLNYRLGVFGFMAHPQLTAESPTRSSGNYGLMDQLAGLRWVKRNIAAFGGDPDRVTVFGQSAGALSIEALLTAPTAEGLFQQVIMQSVGAMRPAVTLAEAETFGRRLGPNIAELRKMSAADLNAKLKPAEGTFRDVTGPRGLGPIVDGVLLPLSDRAAFTTGHATLPPMIVGSVENEGGAFTRSAPIHTPAAFHAYLERNFEESVVRADQMYPAATDGEAKQQLDQLFSDTQFNYGTRSLLRLASAKQPRIWRYLFTQRRNSGIAAPVHGDELQYVFGTLPGPHKGRIRPFDASDIALSNEMADAWIRFARTGDPNGGNLAHWPTYDASNDNYLEFGHWVAANHFGALPRLDFLAEFFCRRALGN